MHVKLFIKKLFTTTAYLFLNCELKILRTILMLLRDNYLHKIRKYILLFEEKWKQKNIGLA